MPPSAPLPNIAHRLAVEAKWPKSNLARLSDNLLPNPVIRQLLQRQWLDRWKIWIVQRWAGPERGDKPSGMRMATRQIVKGDFIGFPWWPCHLSGARLKFGVPRWTSLLLSWLGQRGSSFRPYAWMNTQPSWVAAAVCARFSRPSEKPTTTLARLAPCCSCVVQNCCPAGSPARCKTFW